MTPWRNWERGWLLLGLLFVAMAAYVWVDESYVPDLSGRWSSRGCESLAKPDGSLSRLTRTYVFGPDSWHLTLTFFSDADCAQKLFALDVSGQYELGRKSERVYGANEGRYSMEKLTLTPYTADMAALFSGGKCGNGPWVTGAGQDVTKTGCLEGVPSAAACPVEYDLVRRQDDALWFGDRSVSLCRPGVYPARLGSVPVVKQP